MPGFEKTKLATGEFRCEYVRRRLQEGALPKAVLAEINAAGMYSGPEGKTWPMSVVSNEKAKLQPSRKAREAIAAEATAEEPANEEARSLPIPEEYRGVLSQADWDDIQRQAAADLAAKKKAEAKKEAFKKVRAELERQAKLADQRGIPQRDLMDVVIDLAPYAPNIRLDGEVFEHGRTYRRPRAVAAVLYEQMQRSWEHQASISGKNENAYRQTFQQRRRNGNPTAGVAGPLTPAVQA